MKWVGGMTEGRCLGCEYLDTHAHLISTEKHLCSHIGYEYEERQRGRYIYTTFKCPLGRKDKNIAPIIVCE